MQEGQMLQPGKKLIVLMGFLSLLNLPACAKVEQAVATGGAAVQRGTAKVGDGADTVGSKLRSGMDKTSAKLDQAGEKADRAAKGVGSKLEN